MGFPMLTVQRVTDKRLSNETRISLNLQCHSFAQGTQITAAVSHLQLEATGARHK